MYSSIVLVRFRSLRFIVFCGDRLWDQLVHLITHLLVVDIFRLRIQQHNMDLRISTFFLFCP